MVSFHDTFGGEYEKKTERIQQEMFYINEKKVFHLKELMETFAISKSTALRDIQELEALGGATICREWTLWWLSGLAKYVVAAHLL